MTATDILDAINHHHLTKGECATRIALSNEDFMAFPWPNGAKVTLTMEARIFGVQVVSCPDTEPGTVEVLLP